jgi:hypothetical protein
MQFEKAGVQLGSKKRLILAGMLAFIVGSSPALAGPINGTLYFTTFAGGENVHSVDFSYNGSNSFSLSNIKNIAATQGPSGVAGADGLVFTTDGQLAVGGQGNVVYKVNTTNGQVTSVTAGNTNAFHMMATPDGHILSSSIPGTPAVYPGNLSANGKALTFKGGTDQFVDTISFDNKGNGFYTSSSSSGNGSFGRISLDLTNDTYTTTRLIAPPLPAAHGMTFDPFTGDLILFGAEHITQIDPTTGSIVSDLNLSSLAGQHFTTFDQGTVDGQGHLYVANNGGDLLFLDYSATGVVGGVSPASPGTRNIAFVQFLANNLDDVAPLVGPGAISVTPEPASLVLLSVGGLALLGYRSRRRTAS